MSKRNSLLVLSDPASQSVGAFETKTSFKSQQQAK